jgi:hypothetical protein
VAGPEIDEWFQVHSEDFDDLNLEAVEGKVFDRYPASSGSRTTAVRILTLISCRCTSRQRAKDGNAAYGCRHSRSRHRQNDRRTSAPIATGLWAATSMLPRK